MKSPSSLVRDVVVANRILARFGILDAYGHVSVRDPRDAGRYLISRSLAPEIVADRDIVVLDLDSAPPRTERRLLYAERFIHGELYRARPDVQAIVHHHSVTTVAFSVTGTPLRAIYHMSGFLGDGLPVWEIREAAGKATDMLVRTPEIARALAKTVGAAHGALMRGHGAVVAGKSLAQVVARSIYMEVNARIQLDALRLGGPVNYLDPEESRMTVEMHGDYPRAWEMWTRAVSASPRKRGLGSSVAGPHVQRRSR